MTQREWTFLIAIAVLGCIVIFMGGVMLGGTFFAPDKNIDNNKSEPVSPTPNYTTKPQTLFDPTAKTTIEMPEGLEKAQVQEVVDGDTIKLTDGRTIRFIGIDTPETKHPSKGVECYGKEASIATLELLGGKDVMLEKDVSDTDRYKRLLRYVYVEDIMVNEYLVLQGFAFSSSYPPDVKYQERFVQAQQEAYRNGRGLWEACKVSEDKSSVLGYAIEESSKLQTPQAPAKENLSQKNNQVPSTNNQLITNNQYSNDQTTTPIAKSSEEGQSTTAVSTKQEGCLIKGNISSEKIYHLPGCGSYEKTTIVESQGERWFCTEQEALAAGWRKAKNC